MNIGRKFISEHFQMSKIQYFLKRACQENSWYLLILHTLQKRGLSYCCDNLTGKCAKSSPALILHSIEPMQNMSYWNIFPAYCNSLIILIHLWSTCCNHLKRHETTLIHLLIDHGILACVLCTCNFIFWISCQPEHSLFYHQLKGLLPWCETYSKITNWKEIRWVK